MALVWLIPIFLSGVWTYDTPSSLPKLAEPPLKVGAFNIQVFGETKYEKVEVREYLIKIILRYDLILVQEIRDRLMIYMQILLDDVNRQIQDASQHYKMSISDRLGTTANKEQYAYVYRGKRLRVVKTYQYPEANGQFERPPFVALFESPTTELKQFLIIGDHTKPKNAMSEIDNLKDVYDRALALFGEENILIAGDLNADCTYLHKEDKAKLRLRQGSLFKWLIKEDTDTTVGNSDCAYDRFITAGPGWENAIVPGSIGIFNFEKAYGLSHTLAEDVSDHFPIEFDMEGKQYAGEQRHIVTQMTAQVTNEKEVKVDDIKKIYLKSRSTKMLRLPSSWYVKVFKFQNKNDHVEATRSNLDAESVVNQLLDFNQKLGSQVISPQAISFVKTYVEKSTFTQESFVYGVKIRPVHTYDITVNCRLISPYICSVSITKLEFMP